MALDPALLEAPIDDVLDSIIEHNAGKTQSPKSRS